MSKKLTPWFPEDVNPVRVGYYERDWYRDGSGDGGFLPDLWNGERWQNSYPMGLGRAIDSCQNLRWRGLAKKP